MKAVQVASAKRHVHAISQKVLDISIAILFPAKIPSSTMFGDVLRSYASLQIQDCHLTLAFINVKWSRRKNSEIGPNRIFLYNCLMKHNLRSWDASHSEPNKRVTRRSEIQNLTFLKTSFK